MTDQSSKNTDLLTAYKLAFGSPAGKQVLEDLSAFCRAVETPIVRGDHDMTMVLLGRNEVWRRIQTLVQLTEQEIYKLRMSRQRGLDRGDDSD